MALVHNVFIRTLNCIYLQALNVKEEKDASDFIIFAHSWVIMLHEHHGNEEKFYFPWLEADIGTTGAMEKNIQQHHAFESGLSAFEAYVVAVKDGKEKYDGAKIVALIDAFGSILTTHLTEEIATFEELEKLGDKINWKEWNKKVQKLAIDTAEKVCMGLSSWSREADSYLYRTMKFLSS
jgi:hemerythrin-like domain-containing protein